MAKMKSLEDLFINLLKDMYYAEKQILKALPKMAKQADSSELRRAFEHHLKETRRAGGAPRAGVRPHATLKAAGKTCPAIKGILEEGAEDMKEAADADVLDAGMIADAQAVEHYEIARYGTLIAWANQLGMKEAATLLEPDARAGIQRRPHPDRARGEQPEPAGRCLEPQAFSSQRFAGRRGSSPRRLAFPP